MVLNSQNEVELRTVKVLHQNGKIAVVGQGLKAEELCLIEGQQLLLLKQRLK